MTILRTMRNFSSMNITGFFFCFAHYCELFCGFYNEFFV